jgi:endonuclease YncB( thermonuclease family)
MSGRRRSPRPLRFNLTRKDGDYPVGSSTVLLVGGVLFCGALAFFFKDPEPRTAPGHAVSAGAAVLSADEDTDYGPATPTTLRTAEGPRPGANLPAFRQGRFSLCGKVRRDCVVDGDTFWVHGEKIRIADIDTPEISRPRCREEHALGIRATTRLLELLNEGPFDLVQPQDGRDRDRYGRALRDVRRGGMSIGDQLVAEGLARKWEGRRNPWC